MRRVRPAMLRLARRGSELKLVVADRQEARRDRGLIGRLAKGYLWFEELRTGCPATIRMSGRIASSENVPDG